MSASFQTIIIHPVLKIGLKIICKILFAQIETSMAGKVELTILWAIVIRVYWPHFGHLLMKWFHIVIRLRSGSGKNLCGGLITLIAHVYPN